MTRGIKIETFMAGGRYQHKIYDINVGNKRELAVSEKVVEMQKRVNETLWDEIPVGSRKLVAVIQYTPPKK